MQEETKTQLDHLARILRRLSLKEAGFILSAMAEDHSFKVELLNYLGSRVFYPEILVKELSHEHLVTLFKNLEIEVCIYLYHNYPEFKLALAQVVEGISKKKVKNYTEEEILLALQSTISKLVSESKISYNGKSLLFFPPNCKGKDKFEFPKVVVEVLNPIVRVGSPIQIFIDAPKYSSQYVKISFQQLETKFFSNGVSVVTYQLDSNGVFIGEIRPQDTVGLTSVWVEFPEGGQIHRSVLFTSSIESNFFIYLDSLQKEDRYYVGKVKLFHKREVTNKEKIYIQIYCERCGIPLHFCTGILEDSVYKFFIPEKILNLGHSNRLIIHVQHGDTTALKIINKNNINKDILFETRSPLEDFDTLEINEPQLFEIGYSYLCLYSNDKIQVLDYVEKFLTKSENLEKFTREPNPKNPNPLEMSIASRDIILLEEWKTQVFYKYFFVSHLQYNLKLELNNFLKVESLYIVLLQKENTWKFYKALEYPRLSNIQISAEVPKFLDKGEEVEAFIYYNVNQKTYLKILSPRPQTFVLENKGFVRVYLRAEEILELEYLNDTKEIVKKTYLSKSREWIFNEIVLKFKENLDRENLKEILEILAQMYLDYKWLGLEQIAAKLVGLCFFMSLLEPKKRWKIKDLISSYLNVLQSYQSETGYFRVSSKSYTDKEITKIIYLHLKLCLPYKSNLVKDLPKLYELIDCIQKILFDKVNENSSLDFVFEDLKNSYLYFEKKENQLHLYRRLKFFSKNALSLLLLRSLYLKDQDSFLVSKKRKNKKEIKYNSGFIGVLEKLNILTPQVNQKIETKLEEIQSAKSFLTQNIYFLYPKNSSLSTIELSCFWKLYLTLFELGINPENFPYFEKNLVQLEPEFKTTALLRLDKFCIEKGNYLNLQFDKEKLFDKIIRIYYPSIVEPLFDSNFYLEDGELAFYPRFYHTQYISWKAIKKGKGKFYCILENPYDPSNFEFITIGEIQVS